MKWEQKRQRKQINRHTEGDKDKEKWLKDNNETEELTKIKWLVII